MKNQKLFYKNSFKNILINKIQMFVIIILIFLTSFIFTLSYSSSERINKSYLQFINESNLHDFVIDLSDTNYKNDFDNDKFKIISDYDVKNNLFISYVQDKLKTLNIDFIFDRIESRVFNLSSGKIIKVFAINPDQQIDKLIVSKGMPIKLWKNYNQAINNYTKKWVYINEQFAKFNNIKINDIIRLQDDEYGSTLKVDNSEKQKVEYSMFKQIDINLWIKKTKYNLQNWFQVVGFASSADFSTPIIDKFKPLPNTKNEGLAYVNSLNFGINYVYYNNIFPNNDFNFQNKINKKIWYTNSKLKNNETLKIISEAQKEIYYVGKFKNRKNINNNNKIINNYMTNLNKGKEIGLYLSFINIFDKNKNISFIIGDKNYLFHKRTTFLKKIIIYYKLINYIIIFTTLGISTSILIMILQKQIVKTFRQIGVLMAIGYKISSLIWSSSLYPFIISITGGICGCILGESLQNIIIKIFDNFFSIKIINFEFSWKSMLVIILGIFLFLELITLITNFWIMKKYSALEMINYINAKHTSNFKLKLKKILTRRQTFKSQFKGAIISSSISKLLCVFGVILISSSLITFGISIFTILDDYKIYKYHGNNYNNIIEYTGPIYNSPLSFYKTYNPYITTNTNINDNYFSSDNLIKMYITNNIPAKFYELPTDISNLNNMTYKTISIDYLKNPNLNIDFPKNITEQDKNIYFKTIIFNLWPDLKNYNIHKYWDKNAFLNVITSNNKIKENIEYLEKLRQFYIKYRNTIGLDIRRKEYFLEKNYITPNKPNNINTKEWPLITRKEFKNIFINDKYKYHTTNINDNGSIKNDNIFEKSLFNYLNYEEDEFISQILFINIQIYNWIKAFFYNNLQQAFLQGIYQKIPIILKEKFNNEYYSSKNSFNFGFGIIPFNEKKDDIGVFLNGNIKHHKIKIYGINKNNKTQELKDIKNYDLTHKLFAKNANNQIIINQTIAKKLNLSVGDKININHIIPTLTKNNKEINIDTWDCSEISAEDQLKYTKSSNIYLNSIFNIQNKGWINKIISNEKKEFIYQSNIDQTSESKIGPTLITREISKGLISIKNINKKNIYKIVGITNQYDINSGWINNNLALKISKFEEIKKIFFQIFMKEWINPKYIFNKHKYFIHFIQKNIKIKNKEIAYNNFLHFIKHKNNYIYKKLFDNEYPIFNYKMSNDETVTDISKMLSITQLYGDYSMFGLNGGISKNQNYSGYSTNTIQKIIQISEALKIIERINITVNYIIYFIIIISILLSAIIIFLIINTLIKENGQIIAIMKILGYKQFYIIKLFISIYVPVVIVSSLLGFGITWGLIILITNTIKNIVVLPIIFKWWYILTSILSTWLIYICSSIISWNDLKKVNIFIIAGEEG